MGFGNALNNANGISNYPAKIIPPRSEGCIAPQACQYYTSSGCSLEECPFRSPREMNGAESMRADGTQDSSTVMNTPKKCYICGREFRSFIGAVPICSTCVSRLKYLVDPPKCPGCGTSVANPAMLCASCKESYLSSGDE